MARTIEDEVRRIGASHSVLEGRKNSLTLVPLSKYRFPVTNTEVNSPAQGQAIILGAVTVGILLSAVILMSSIVTSETGGISATVRAIGIALAVGCLIRPKMGMYVVTIEAFSLDFIKKVAVYYGSADTMTIAEVLVVGMLAVIGTIGGVSIQSMVFRRYQLRGIHWAIIIVSIIVSVAVIIAGFKLNGFTKATEDGFNTGVYIALAPPLCLLFTDRERLH